MNEDIVIPLVKKAQSGNRNAFENLLQEIYDDMYKMAFHFCGNKENAEDITQNACIKLARSLSQFKFRSAFSTWVYRVVINCARDLYSVSKRHQGSEIHENDGQNPCKPDMNAHHNQVMQQIYDLPENEKNAILLVFAQGMSHAQAGKILGCKESTVSWYIHEARKKLDNFNQKETGS